MSCEQCNDEMRSVVRRQNRTLRLVNRNLRRKVEGLEIHSDELFFTLCDTDPRAELVLVEVCEKLGVEFTNYDDLADKIVQRISHTSVG